MKIVKLALLMLCLMTIGAVLAQSNPTIQIVLSQPTAQQGDTVMADVYVRNPVYLAGADIGITTDDKCLKIVDRQQGPLLPNSESGSFSPLAEMKDHETRLAVAITNRTKTASADGVFFQARLMVTCATGIGSVTVSFGELSAYKDPTAADVGLVSYTMSAGTVNVVNAQLAIGPAGQVTAIPTQPVPTSVAAPTQPQPTAAVSATPAPAAGPTQNEPPLIPAIIIIILVTVVIFAVLVIVSRRRNDQ